MHRPPAIGDRRTWPLWLALAATTVGVILIAVAVAAQVRSPQPPRSIGRIEPAAPTRAGRSSTSAVSVPPSGRQPLTASRPVTISIPSIKVRSRVLPIGLAPDGTLAVPQPGPNLDRAAWYRDSPTPGTPGPSIIEGHVDSQSGPSVFFELGAIRPGAKIRITRADGLRVDFTVSAVRDYLKSRFPTSVVYGSKDLSRPELRLITCSNFDAAIGHHIGDEVVFAHLTATHPVRR
jgi:sortase (surface protein transpeptidase)